MGSKISCSSCNPKPVPSSGRPRADGQPRRDGHVLRLWAEVFHVSASSGAVRWTQLSDDLVPITVTAVSGRFHVTAYNSRVDKVLDTWLTGTRLGQASNCFVYWKDAVSGDTWGLNFTSAQDARSFRECIQSSGRSANDFRRAESSYSLREREDSGKRRERTLNSVPSSPSKKNIQRNGTKESKRETGEAPQCTCDCMTSEALHKQRNGRIRYAAFARQDSSGTTQSSRSDGSLVRRQHERQQYFANRGHVRSMEEQLRVRSRADAARHQQARSATAQAQMRSKSTEDVRRQVASTGTTTDDLPTTTTTTAQTLSSEALKRMLREVGPQGVSERPKSLAETTDRSRSRRSLEGRRRSLERTQCVDLTDASPPTPRRRREDDVLLDEVESELRRRLQTQTSADAADAFESLLRDQMDDVQTLMREVQRELNTIRAEERRFKSLSTQSLLARSSAPILDTLSIDGQLPFVPLTPAGHSSTFSHHTPFESLSIASMMTSSEVSDDEKASLTTAISDDDDESPMRTRSGASAANVECLGSVRKSGFLCVKKWLLRKRHSLELARRRGWKGYWVCLKGTTLLFYGCESRDGHSIDASPKHLIFVDQCLAQSVPEHPKRDHVFCLSTAFGDAYLLDAPCLEERDLWVQAIHSACSAQFARSSGKAAVAHALREEIGRLERTTDTESRTRHETELLLTCVAPDDARQRQQLVSAIMSCDEKSEKQRVDAFRLKCYVSAVEGLEDMPNPKTVLSLTNRRTKSQLNRLGVFTVSSLHAFNCAKNPSIVGSLLRRQKSDEKDIPPPLVREDQLLIEVDVVLTTTGERRRIRASGDWMSDQLLLHLMSSAANAREYFVCEGGRPLTRNQRLDELESRELQVVPKVLFTVELSRDTNDVLFGFSVESELNSSDLCVFVSRVESASIAANHGLRRNDELVVINGALVHDLDMMFVESLLQEECNLCLMVRSSRSPPTQDTRDDRETDAMIESLVCPPPPEDRDIRLINSDQLKDLIVPKVDAFLPNADVVVVVPDDTRTTPIRSENKCEDRMRKVVRELVDTEVTYVAALEALVSQYLEPLAREPQLLSSADVQVLFGQVQDIISAQKRFCRQLTQIVDSDGSVDAEAVANVFLTHSPQFRQYSTFCASHSRAVKLLADDKSAQGLALREWLSRRCGGQLAQSLESHLIRPIQRVLKYPLLLQQMKNLCPRDSNAARLLDDALRAVESVAEHINEMQRVHEEYGAVFEHLSRAQQRNAQPAVDLAPTALLHYGGVQWLNACEFLGKASSRRGLELHSMAFVFRACVVFLCKETVRRNKRPAAARAEVEIIRHQTLIPVVEVQVRASHAEGEHDFKWELIQLKTAAGKRSEKIYRLANSSAELRNAFLRTIRQIIRDDVRQMSCQLKAKQKADVRDDGRDDDRTTAQTVACGLCGKDVSIGCRAKDHSSGSTADSPVWKRRQDSSSTSR